MNKELYIGDGIADMRKCPGYLRADFFIDLHERQSQSPGKQHCLQAVALNFSSFLGVALDDRTAYLLPAQGDRVSTSASWRR